VRKAVAAVAAAVALAGAAIAAVPLVEQRAAASIKREIEAPGLAEVEEVRVGLFDRSVTFTNLRSRGIEGISAGHWSLSGLAWPLGELLRGNTPFGGWGPGQPLRAQHLEMKDVRLGDGLRSLRLASLSVEGLDLERYDPDTGTSSAQELIGVARILQAVRLRRLDLAGFSFSDAMDGSRFAVASVALGDVDHGTFGTVQMSGLEVAGEAAGAPAFRLDEVQFTGLDFTRVLRSVSAPTWRPGRPTGRVNLVHGHASGFGGELMSRYGVSLGKVTTDATREAGGVLQTRSRVEGFVYAPPLRGLENIQARAVMAAMGLGEVRLDIDCAGTENRDRGEAQIGHCTLAGPDLAEIDLSARVEKGDAAFWSALDGGDMAAMMRSSVVLVKARLVLADKGLIDKAFRGAAVLSRRPADQARQSFAQEVRRFQPAGVLITDDLTKLLDTAARFVEKGGTLTIEANPDPPFGMAKVGYLMKPGPDLIDLLGITATLEPKR